MRSSLVLLCCLLSLSVIGFGEDSQKAGGIEERALQELRSNDWPSARRDFREVVRRDPSNVFAQMYLGQTLFRQSRQKTRSAISFTAVADAEDAHGIILEREKHAVVAEAGAESPVMSPCSGSMFPPPVRA